MPELENAIDDCIDTSNGPAQAASAVEGWGLNLRLVEPNDAAYIHSLRSDKRYNAHLPAVSGEASDLRAWIERYKHREQAGCEYYFIIERRADNKACGLVRLYDINGDQFTWGSWILDEKKPAKAALESAFLIYQFAFEHLGIERCVFDVRLKNEHTLAFHRRCGLHETNYDTLSTPFQYLRSTYFADKSRYMKLLTAVSFQ